jgi:hypothetical protein
MKKVILLLLIVCGTILPVLSQKRLGILEYAYNATVKIETVDSVVKKAGKEIVYGENGTGFFFVFQTNKGSIPVIVTNRHVIQSAASVTFYFLEADGNKLPVYNKQQKITLKKEDLAAFYHPDNTVDLVIIPVNPMLAYFEKQKIRISYNPLNETIIPRDSVFNTTVPMEDLYLVSHPAGLEKELHSLPLISKGSTATPLFLDHNAKKEFLAELPVYDGNAGAPVIVYQSNNITRSDEQMSGHRIVLAGIYAATYTKGFHERALPPGKYPADATTTNSYENIGIIIKSQRLRDFVKLLNDLK